MGRGIMWQNKCSNCNHSQARHKKCYDKDRLGRDYIVSFGRCLCNCECEEFVNAKTSESQGGKKQ